MKKLKPFLLIPALLFCLSMVSCEVFYFGEEEECPPDHGQQPTTQTVDPGDVE